jgi:hypothetical protein
MEQRIFKDEDSRVCTIKSYRQVEAQREPVYRDMHREVDEDSTDAAYREWNYQVNQMVTKADFQRRCLVKEHLRVIATYR